MSKKSDKKAMKPLTTGAAAKPSVANSPAERKMVNPLWESKPFKAASPASQPTSPAPPTPKQPNTPAPVRSIFSPPPPAPPPKAAVTEKAPALLTPRAVNVLFVLHSPQAKKVSLCGDFNQWSPDATPLKQQDAEHWATTLALQPGRYEYKFVADGQWLNDPKAQENVPNLHGSLNSVIEVLA